MKSLLNKIKIWINNYLKNRKEALELLEREDEKERQREKIKANFKRKLYSDKNNYEKSDWD